MSQVRGDGQQRPAQGLVVGPPMLRGQAFLPSFSSHCPRGRESQRACVTERVKHAQPCARGRPVAESTVLIQSRVVRLAALTAYELFIDTESLNQSSASINPTRSPAAWPVRVIESQLPGPSPPPLLVQVLGLEGPVACPELPGLAPGTGHGSGTRASTVGPKLVGPHCSGMPTRAPSYPGPWCRRIAQS